MRDHKQHIKIVTQHSKILGHVNVSFLTDPEYPVNDCLVSGGDWVDSVITVSECTLIADRAIIDLLTPRVFRAESNNYDLLSYEVSSDEATYFEQLIEWKLRSSGGNSDKIIRQILDIGRNWDRKKP